MGRSLRSVPAFRLTKIRQRSPLIRDAMREFKAAETKHKQTEKQAVFALRELGANLEPNIFLSSIYLVPQVLFHRRVVYSEIADGGVELWYPQGFFKEMAPLLSELHRLRTELFEVFPRELFYSINWELLKTVEFSQFSRLLLPRFTKKSPEEQYTTAEEIALLSNIDAMEVCRRSAERAIDKALLVIDKYEEDWL